jgi:hypothetical protein
VCVPPTHLALALGAVIHGPLLAVLVHDAVVDAHAAVDVDAVPNVLVLNRLDTVRGNDSITDNTTMSSG